LTEMKLKHCENLCTKNNAYFLVIYY